MKHRDGVRARPVPADDAAATATAAAVAEQQQQPQGVPPTQQYGSERPQLNAQEFDDIGIGEDNRQTWSWKITAKDNTERVQPITDDMKHGLTPKATADEIYQLRSVTQSLAWIARQTRPDLSYRISKIQSTFEMHVLESCANAIELWNMQHLHPRVASIFLRIFLDDAVVVTISDASFCQEQEQIDGVTQSFKSQQACITALAPGNALDAEKMLIHPLSWSSTRIRRVCRSTLMAEAHALSNPVEHGLRTMHGCHR